MIQLRNVSKYYYSKGMIASGISKVNLEFDLGEFVVITGESGSGKSTLLNVISGLDSYEEGEMYINGEETSHYLAADFEEYRKKYIGNIFQSFNLVNSYTVYQNIELILLINGYRKEEIKRRVTEIIDRVGLSAFTKTKVSKLSGGQRQRVSIARALAKDTDIIVADEPTGNLDSESARGIAQLLSEISRDKLVIVVTHNYDQFEEFATRRVKMHDGKVIENVTLRTTYPPAEDHIAPAAKKMTGGSVLRLGVRNTFNIFYKFLLLLIVFLFLVFAVSSQYTTFANKKYESSMLGYSSYFQNYSNDRIVLKKQDNGAFTQDDYDVLSRLDNVKTVVTNDILLDTTMYLESEMLTIEAYPRSVSEFPGQPEFGRMPEASGEAILKAQDDEYMLSRDMAEDVIDTTFQIWMDDGNTIPLKVVGISFDTSEDEYRYAGEIYLIDDQLDQMRTQNYNNGSTITSTINGKEMEAGMGDAYYGIRSSSKVASGSCVVGEDMNNFFEDEDEDFEEEEDENKVSTVCVGKPITVKVENMFYEESLPLTIGDVYTEKTFQDKTGNEDYDSNDGAIFVSEQDYQTLFGKGNYQYSVYVKDVKQEDDTVRAIRDLGYVTLPLKDTVMAMDGDIISMLEVPITILIIAAIFCIAYIVAGLILRSRSSYFSILRMLGLARRSIHRILDVEVLLVVNIAFAIFLVVVRLVKQGYINIEYINTLIEFLKVRDYAGLYLLVAIMALLISAWFARRLFKKTAMGSFREEV